VFAVERLRWTCQGAKTKAWNMRQVKLAVIGAGAIGKRHAELIVEEPTTLLAAIVDPQPSGREVAARLGAKCFSSLAGLLQDDRPDGVIIATPNHLHVAHGLEAIAAGLPAMVEKPIADDAKSGAVLVEAARAADVPLLVGHHRRYNPIVRTAKAVIDSGRLGQIVSIQASVWLMKPDGYFDIPWRREKGAGPLLINLIHDVDLLRYLCGEVGWAQADASNAVRGNPVEDSAGVLLRFESGALATISISDTIAAPWSWELTSGENACYPQQDAYCYQIGGTQGSLTIPQLEIWSYTGERSWMAPMRRERLDCRAEDALKLQIRNFRDVIRGQASPLVSGEEGLATLKVLEAIRQAVATGARIVVT
jgi:predicted dehydrogenase